VDITGKSVQFTKKTFNEDKEGCEGLGRKVTGKGKKRATNQTRRK
jgi:hypothetical protein